MTDGGTLPLNISVLSSFTAAPVRPAMTFWTDRLGISTRLWFAPYNQVLQELRRPGHDPGPGTNAVVVLVRMEDFIPADPGATTASVGDELAATLDAAASRSPRTTFLVAVGPPSPVAGRDPVRRRLVDESSRVLRHRLAAVANVGFVDSEEVVRQYSVARVDDPYADQVGHIPYTPEYFSALGTALVRRLYRTVAPEPKVLVVDCDNTLWDGVLGEDGPAAVRVGLARQQIQEFLVEQRRAGRLLCLSTKNDRADVENAFAVAAGMRLTLDDFVHLRANWRPKSENLHELAKELGLALASFVFLDDSPLECADVQAHCPEVAVVPLPPDASRALQALRHCWPLDVATVTDEASRRTALYRDEQRRQQLRTQTLSLAEFVDSLELRVTIRRAEAADRARMVDLMRRTTQFNLTGSRLNASEIEALPDSVDQQVVEVEDRFGSYGTVGLLTSFATADSLEVGTFLLSCRALGRGVEHQMLAALGRQANERRLGRIRLLYNATARNRPARQFLAEVAEPEPGGPEVASAYVLRAQDAAQLRYRPHSAPAADDGPSWTVDDHQASDGTATLVSWYEVAGLADELTTAHKILDAIRGVTGSRPGDGRPGADEADQLARIWAEILEVGPDHLDGDFATLGGTSLELVQLLARVYDEFGTELPVDELLDDAAVTVDRLLAMIRSQRADAGVLARDRIPWVEP